MYHTISIFFKSNHKTISDRPPKIELLNNRQVGNVT